MCVCVCVCVRACVCICIKNKCALPRFVFLNKKPMPFQLVFLKKN